MKAVISSGILSTGFRHIMRCNVQLFSENLAIQLAIINI